MQVAQKKRERQKAQAAEAKELQKFALLKAMAAPFAGTDINADQTAVQKAGEKAAGQVRPGVG